MKRLNRVTLSLAIALIAILSSCSKHEIFDQAEPTTDSTSETNETYNVALDEEEESSDIYEEQTTLTPIIFEATIDGWDEVTTTTTIVL